MFSFNDLIKTKIQYSEENDFFLHNYKIPEIEDVKFEKKNNLIIIMLESFNTRLRYTEDDTTCYIPQVETLYTKYQQHGQLINCNGTDWTIAALTAWNLGIPLKLPGGANGNSYTGDKFLPHAVSVFEVMKEHDYSSYLVMGTPASFSGMNNLFKHGNFSIYDSSYYIRQNIVNEQNGHLQDGWRVFDNFIYDETYKKYLELREQEKPFVLFMETNDTHFPPGYCKKNKEIYGDVRDSWIEADKLLYDFIKKMEPFLETDNVNILIFGDHGPYSKQLSHNRKQPLFNLFMGKSLPQIPEGKVVQKINPMDIAPTILQAAGAKWDNNQFGLGISIFSEDKSFSEIYGIEELDEILIYYSKFYDSFF